ncbi:ABC transporter permease [Flavobacterium sp. '19STA2R22 D10 B1']|uniref:ABC transporter permease n=1 Tax=Flavobacterium aerium TaxID=3037261 RepID=UPI00278C269F|nr:ABC transporter permease [Flavobacterium sp. '19STA2R22 D10 B1']
MKNFIFLMKREFSFFWSNKILRLLFIGAPIMYGILLGYVYEKGKVTDLSIIVVDEDHSNMSNKAIQMFDDNEVINVSQIKYDPLKVTDATIEDGAACVVMIPKNFEADILLKKYPEVTIFVNTSNILTANYASSAIQLCLGTLRAGIEIETLKKQGVPESIAATQYEPFRMSFIKKYNRSTNYMYFLWPGVLATILQQVLLLALALSFASEYENNTFKDLVQKAPSTFKLIAVKIIPYMIMSFGIWLLYALFAWWFRVPLNTHMWDLTLVAGIFVLAVSCIGIVVSILIPNQLKATEVLMVIATPSFIISGFTWPLSQMPGWIQTIADCIPLTHFLKIFRVLVVEGGSLSQVSDSIWAMIIIGLVCGFTAYIALHFKIKKTLRTIK